MGFFQKSLLSPDYIGLEREIIEVTTNGKCFKALDNAIENKLVEEDIETLRKIRHIFSWF